MHDNRLRRATPPTTEEVVALIAESKSRPMRQPDRHIIKDLLTHRDNLARRVDELQAFIREGVSK